MQAGGVGVRQAQSGKRRAGDYWARCFLGHWPGSADAAARPCCRLRASAARSAGRRRGWTGATLPGIKMKISRRAGCGAWCRRGVFVPHAIRSAWPDGLCMPRPASAKLASSKPARAKA